MSMKTSIPKSVINTETNENTAYWQHHIKAQSKSGIIRSAYCKINHVHYGRLSYWTKNYQHAQQQTEGSVIPIRLKREVSHKVNADESRILCTLKFTNGVTLSIQDKETLCLLLKEMV